MSKTVTLSFVLLQLSGVFSAGKIETIKQVRSSLRAGIIVDRLGLIGKLMQHDKEQHFEH
jgi:hypothetical protein